MFTPRPPPPSLSLPNPQNTIIHFRFRVTRDYKQVNKNEMANLEILYNRFFVFHLNRKSILWSFSLISVRGNSLFRIDCSSVQLVVLLPEITVFFSFSY